MTIICFVYRKLEENYNYRGVLSKVILCPIIIHCFQVSFSERSCSRRLLPSQRSAIKFISVDTFGERASERLKTIFFQHPRLSKISLKELETKSVVKCIVSEFLYIEISNFRTKMFVINHKIYQLFSFTAFQNTFSFRRFRVPSIKSKSIFTIRGAILLLQYGTLGYKLNHHQN